MIFDFHLMVDRTDDPMDLSQMISALILVFNVCSVNSNFISQSANRNFDQFETDLKERGHGSAQFSVSLIQMWL